MENTCPVCGERAEYFELECSEPFTAPAPLAFKALTIWGAYGASKELLHAQGGFVHFRLGDAARLVKMLPFNQEDWERRQESVNDRREPCEHKGCEADGYPCFTIFEPDEPMGFYCETHMGEHGICPGCHRFMSGFESFDFSQTGYCEGCSEALQDECDEEPDDEFFDHDPCDLSDCYPAGV